MEIAQSNLRDAIKVYFRNNAYDLEEMGLALESIQDMTGSTAQHVPQGICLIYDAKKDLSQYMQHREEIATTQVTSAILQLLDIPTPSYMSVPPKTLVDIFLS